MHLPALSPPQGQRKLRCWLTGEMRLQEAPFVPKLVKRLVQVTPLDPHSVQALQSLTRSAWVQTTLELFVIFIANSSNRQIRRENER